MKTITKTIAGLMTLALALGIAGCGSQGEVSQKRACEAFDKFGAEETDLEELVDRISSRSGVEGGYYYTTDDEAEAKGMVENIIFRFDEIPDLEYQACTYFAASFNEDHSMAMIYVVTFDDKNDAKELFNNTDSDFSFDDNYASGSSSGIEYAVHHDEDRMFGVYLQDNTVLYIRAVADETEGLKPYEGIIKDMGLFSPLSV